MLTFQLLSSETSKPTMKGFNEIGYEIYAAEEKVVWPKSRAFIDTSIRFTFPYNYYGLIISLPEHAEHSIDVSASIINNETESVKVLVINNSDLEFHVYKRERIALMVVNKFFDHGVLYEYCV